jgi:hypothetical protein
MFGTGKSALINGFYFMLGSVDGSFPEETVSPSLATALLVVFMLFMVILMLNLLIALMGDTFGRVKERSLRQWRYEQMMIMMQNCEIAFWSKRRLPRIAVSRHKQGYFDSSKFVRFSYSTYVEMNETDFIYFVVTEDRLHEYSEYFEGPTDTNTDTNTEPKSNDSELRDALQQMKLDLLDESKKMINELQQVGVLDLLDESKRMVSETRVGGTES